MYCTYCNSQNNPGSKFCESCGKPLNKIDSKSVAPLVAEPKQEAKGSPRKWLLLITISILLVVVGYVIWSYTLPGPNGIFQSPTIPMASNVQPGEMVFISSGEFQMGCDQSNPNEECHGDELPLHTVFLDAYQIHKYEVTNEQYARFLNERRSIVCGSNECMDLDTRDSHIRLRDGQYVVEADYENHPVIYVSWYGANSFCSESGGRLPSEAEWEKAARGSSDTRMYPWGNQPADCTRGNFNFPHDNGYCVGDTAPVGSYPSGASPYGAFNMADNVSEWVNDWHDWETDYYAVSPDANPPGFASGESKLNRGGNWSIENWHALHTAQRWGERPSGTFGSLGFRCAVDAGG